LASEIGDAAGEQRQLPGLFADAQHAYRHGRQNGCGCERI
jgi:hypothetical protein